MSSNVNDEEFIVEGSGEIDLSMGDPSQDASSSWDSIGNAWNSITESGGDFLSMIPLQVKMFFIFILIWLVAIGGLYFYMLIYQRIQPHWFRFKMRRARGEFKWLSLEPLAYPVLVFVIYFGIVQNIELILAVSVAKNTLDILLALATALLVVSTVFWVMLRRSKPPFIRPIPVRNASISSPGKTCHYCAQAFNLPDSCFPKPDHAHHCRSCMRCVAGFDHHCWWVGKCIGRDNYRLFVTFLAVLSFVCLIGLYLAFFEVIAAWSTFQNSIPTEQLTVVAKLTDGFWSYWLAFSKTWSWVLGSFVWNNLVLIGSISLHVFGTVFVLVLYLFHLYLGATKQSTATVLKNARRGVAIAAAGGISVDEMKAKTS